LALRVAGVDRGAEVITTAFTAIPTIGAILEAGAVPVFVDIDADTYLIDLDHVAAAVTERTRAVVPVHIFGSVVDIPALRRRLSPEIAIIEDAAQAHGSRLGSAFAGTLGEFATFSFYPTKNLGGYGDGGAIVCKTEEVARRLRTLRNHGLVDKDTCVEPGANSRLDELQAAILRAKLPHLDAMNAERARIAQCYIAAFPPDRFQPQKIPAEVTSNWHVFQARFFGNRDGLIAHLDARGIQSNVYFVVPHHLQPAMAPLGYQRGSLPNTEKVCGEAIALPLYPEMPASDLEQVIEAIHAYL
jgi:dTDP-4-amino-4,6-dideoxygalactose transaminase